jgi:acetyl esterase
MLDPQARAFLDQLAAAGRPQLHELPPEVARAGASEMTAQLGGPPEAVEVVRELAIPGPAGNIPARLYVPAGAAPRPVLVYYHGGGFVIGSLDGWDPVMRSLANASGCAIVSVDYRLAPEHPFPAAVDDAYAAFEWVAANAAGAFGGDPNRLAVGGDSAGGNLAAVVSLLARDRSGPPIALQLLVYPATDQDFSRSSHQQFGTDHFLTIDMMRWFSAHYTGGGPTEDWRIHPLKATSLAGLPPVHVIVAECDPLHDEGVAYAERIRAEGGVATVVDYPGMIHGFFTFPAALTQGRQAIEDAGAALRESLGARCAPSGEPRAGRPL